MRFISIKDVRINLEEVVVYEACKGHNDENTTNHGIQFRTLHREFQIWFDQDTVSRDRALSDLDTAVGIL
jgi:hypothetical protein